MASADTNVLLRWAIDDMYDQTEKATALLEGDEPVQVADLAISEMVYVLEKVYGLERTVVANYVRGIMALSQVNCNRNLLSRALPYYVEHQQLAFNDCCLAVYAELNRAMPLYTFDKQLAKKLSAAKELA